MSRFKEGVLYYDSSTDRMNVQFYDRSFYDGLHCGESFEIRSGCRWIPVRIEYGSDWYLVGDDEKKINNLYLEGLEIRI